MELQIDEHQIFSSYFSTDSIQPVAYECSKKLEEGHICFDLEEFASSHSLNIDAIKKSQWLGNEYDIDKPFVLHSGNIYLQRYFAYESDIIKHIHRIAQVEQTEQRQIEIQESSGLIELLFGHQKKEIDWQKLAALMTYRQNLSLITGGPGTGKTTTVAKFLAILLSNHPNLNVVLAAPTGKAASRLKESLKKSRTNLSMVAESVLDKMESIPSLTIHRLLGFRKNTHYFKHNVSNPLPYDLIIVDESSMLSVSLMAKLLYAVETGKRLVLLGDRHQLSSVEAGSVFGDLILANSDCTNRFLPSTAQWFNQFLDTKLDGTHITNLSKALSENTVELKKSYRFTDQSDIGKLSKSVLAGTFNRSTEFKNKSVQFYSESNIVALESFFELFANYLKEDDIKKALGLFNKNRILCPSNEGKLGVEDINYKVEMYLSGKHQLELKKPFYHNRPILVTENNYQLGLYNGDVGLIRYDDEGQLKAFFESETGELVSFNPYLLKTVRTVFAMSIHKSQGSEFENVALIIPSKTNKELLSKELVYTGLTRAKDHLEIFSSTENFEKAIAYSVKRTSGINGRLTSL